jgi:putative transposase
MKTSLCIQALQMAYWRKKPAFGLLQHSDRGVQYASADYRQPLKEMGMIQSMSAKGDSLTRRGCLDVLENNMLLRV